jgi:hypothetical protein
VPEAICSKRKRSAQTVAGRNRSWSYARITTNIVSTAQPTAPRSRASIAVATKEPIPGSETFREPTVIASEATTKNQPPDIDIIAFHTRPGMA